MTSKETVTDATSSLEQPDAKAGFEELLEDLFGLNIRSFHSYKALFVSPKTYFDASKTVDWAAQTFTPSARLWLGLIAIIAATRFIWGDADGAFMQAMTAQLEAGFEYGVSSASPDGKTASKLPDIDWSTTLQKAFDLTLIIEPFLMVAILMLLATFIRFWGERLNYVVRLRYLFAIIVPATLANLIFTISIVFAPTKVIGAIGVIQVAVMLGLYTATSLRGPFAGQPHDSAVPKSIVLTLILLASLVLANMIANTIALSIVLLPEVTEAMNGAKSAG